MSHWLAMVGWPDWAVALRNLILLATQAAFYTWLWRTRRKRKAKQR